MSAATAAREAKRKAGEQQSYLVGATKIWKGTLVSARTDGYAYAARSGTTTDIFLGVAYESVDNSGGSAGDKRCIVDKEGSYEFTLSGAAITDIGSAVYALYDNEVTKTATYNQLVGYITELTGTDLVRVRINRAVQ
jgi:hypothetical protein